MYATEVVAVLEHFDDYEAFRNWLGTSYPENATTTSKGSSFRDFVMRLLPETREGRRFGRLEANPRLSHDGGVDAVSTDPAAEPLALQTKFYISEKIQIDEIVSKFQAYEASLPSPSDGRLFSEDNSPAPRAPIYGIATSTRLRGVLAAYEKSSLASREFYQAMMSAGRLVTWDGDDLRRAARQLSARHFNLPIEVVLQCATGTWLHDGDVWLGIVSGRDLVDLEAEHGPGLFYENVRGWLGIEGGRDGETVNQAIQATVTDAPREMLARNNGVTFRASAVDPRSNSVLKLDDASIINGRQTTGALGTVADISGECRIQVKVVRAERGAWAIADAANNQNRVARIELRLARYFREQLVKREFAAAASGTDWLATVIDADREHQELFEILRSLLVGLFCQRPGQLSDNNYSHIRFDLLDGFFEDGEPPSDFYPTLIALARATNEAVAIAARMSKVDPLANVAEQQYLSNFVSAWEVVGSEAHGASSDGGSIKVQQQLSQRVFGTAFTMHYNRLRQRIETEARKREYFA